MMVEGSDYFVYRVPFANRANPAMAVVNDDGTFDIYLNSLVDDDKLKTALRHELEHLEQNHFYDDSAISEIERQAKGGETS